MVVPFSPVTLYKSGVTLLTGATLVVGFEVTIGVTLSSSFTVGRLTIPASRSFGTVIELVLELSLVFEELRPELVSSELAGAVDKVEVLLLEVELFLLEDELFLEELGSLLVVAESEAAKDEVSLSVITDDTSDLFCGVVLSQATKQKHSITDIKSANIFFMFVYLFSLIYV